MEALEALNPLETVTGEIQHLALVERLIRLIRVATPDIQAGGVAASREWRPSRPWMRYTLFEERSSSFRKERWPSPGRS